MDENDLIRRSAEGDVDAFEALVRRRRDRVFWIAFHVVGEAELARDVTQEVLLRLFRVIRRFRKGASFDAWLYRITLNLGIDALRRERPHREAASLDEGAVPSGPKLAAPGGRIPSPAEEMRVDEVRRIFMTLSALLPRKQRFAFILREIEGLSTAEVAAVLRTSGSTVRNHVLQARRVLREELRRRFPEYCRPRSHSRE
ncbi:MAG: RNA polymerase sigma factor [Acidobacteriota bacterium]